MRGAVHCHSEGYILVFVVPSLLYRNRSSFELTLLFEPLHEVVGQHG